MIEPDIDAYGSLARASSLADYIELLALRKKGCTREQLADLVEDRWNLKRKGMVFVPGEDLDEDGSDGYAEQAFSCLDERSDLLGDKYPFEFAGPRLKLRGSVDPTLDPYISLLSITLAHAFRIHTAPGPELVFEDVLGAALAVHGMKVAKFGALAREAKNNFADGLMAAGEILQVPTDPQAVVHPAYANDGGVDIIGHLSWRDRRLGRWVFIGQATCASSEEWKAKIQEPRDSTWSRFLQDEVPPIAFLGVPHHVEASTLRLLVTSNERIVVDRLRLRAMLDEVTAEEKSIIKSIMTAEVQVVAA